MTIPSPMNVSEIYDAESDPAELKIDLDLSVSD